MGYAPYIDAPTKTVIDLPEDKLIRENCGVVNIKIGLANGEQALVEDCYILIKDYPLLKKWNFPDSSWVFSSKIIDHEVSKWDYKEY